MARSTIARPVNNVRHGWQLFRNRKAFWQMMREALSGRYKMSFLTILIAILAIAYIIFPFDLIPDYIPVVGWIDDGLVFYLLLRRLALETQRYNRFKAMERKQAGESFR